MNVQVIFIDMKQKNVNLFINKSITIGRLRKKFEKNGGNGSNNQWKYDGHILENDNIYLENIRGFDSEGMAILVTTNVRGGYIVI